MTELMVKDNLTVKELKKLILTTKKDSKEVSQAYGAILKQVEAQTVGVKNPETDEKKIILNACKKELKEQEQSKSSGAPYSETTMNICDILYRNMSPKLMTESETGVAVDVVINSLDNPNMGQVMGQMKKEYGDMLDMKILSQIVKNKLK